jgi:hypothetical protein
MAIIGLVASVTGELLEAGEAVMLREVMAEAPPFLFPFDYRYDHNKMG